MMISYLKASAKPIALGLFLGLVIGAYAAQWFPMSRESCLWEASKRSVLAGISTAKSVCYVRFPAPK